MQALEAQAIGSASTLQTTSTGLHLPLLFVQS